VGGKNNSFGNNRQFQQLIYLSSIAKTSLMKNSFQGLLLIFSIFASASTNGQNTSMHQAKLNHIAIYVVDLQRSAGFYRNVIGLDTIPEPFHDGKHVWFRTGPGNSLHVISGAEAPKEYFKANHLCFSVVSMDAFTGMLKKKNIPFEDFTSTKNNKVTIRPDGVKQIWLQDPDGYWIEINDAKE
jgi:lactoylglutathione lyase